MDKLLELEQKLKLAKAELSKIMSSSTTATGSVNSTGGTSIASQIGFGKGEDKKAPKLSTEKMNLTTERMDTPALRMELPQERMELKTERMETPKAVKKADKHDDEKEDKKLIAEAIDEHNEDKHGEDKDEDSAFKEKSLKKAGGPNKFGEKKTAIAENVNREQRAPAIDIHPVTGAKTLVTPEAQVKAQADAKAESKATGEAAAKERRAKMRSEGLIKFDKNGQWSMDKDC